MDVGDYSVGIVGNAAAAVNLIGDFEVVVYGPLERSC
jgi:hypothetical protein